MKKDMKNIKKKEKNMNTLIIFVVGVSFGFLISSSLSSTHNKKEQNENEKR